VADDVNVTQVERIEQVEVEHGVAGHVPEVAPVR
jgi:hypothetical protein